MHTYKVIYRRLVGQAWSGEQCRYVRADSIMQARAIVLTKNIQIERIVRC